MVINNKININSGNLRLCVILVEMSSTARVGRPVPGIPRADVPYALGPEQGLSLETSYYAQFGDTIPNNTSAANLQNVTPVANATEYNRIVRQDARGILMGGLTNVQPAYLAPPAESSLQINDVDGFWDTVTEVAGGNLPRDCVITCLTFANSTRPGSLKSKLYNGYIKFRNFKKYRWMLGYSAIKNKKLDGNTSYYRNNTEDFRSRKLYFYMTDAYTGGQDLNANSAAFWDLRDGYYRRVPATAEPGAYNCILAFDDNPTGMLAKRFEKSLQKEMRHIADAIYRTDPGHEYTINAPFHTGRGLAAGKLKYNPITREFYNPDSRANVTFLSNWRLLTTQERQRINARTENAAASLGYLDASTESSGIQGRQPPLPIVLQRHHLRYQTSLTPLGRHLTQDIPHGNLVNGHLQKQGSQGPTLVLELQVQTPLWKMA